MYFENEQLAKLYPVYTIHPVVKPVVKPGCTTLLTTGCIHDTAGCQRFDNRIDNRLYRVNGAFGSSVVCHPLAIAWVLCRFSRVRQVSAISTPTPSRHAHHTGAVPCYVTLTISMDHRTCLAPFPSKLLLRVWGSGPASNTWFIGPTRVHIPNSLASGQPFLQAHGRDRPIDRQTTLRHM